MATNLVAADGVTPLSVRLRAETSEGAPASEPAGVGRLMTTEIAAPAMSSQRSIISGNPAAGLDPVRLASILRGADDGNMIDYLELAEQIEERDPHYAAVLGTRKRQVSQLDVTVEAASDAPVDQAKAQLIRDWLNRDSLEPEFFDMLDAVGKGFSFTEIVWATPASGPWLPERLIWRDPRWFEFDRIDGTTPLLRTSGAPAPLPAFKFVCHVHGNKSGLPVRGGVARVAVWAFLFKSFSLKDWLEFAEVYGFPIRVGKYQPGATDDQIRTLLRAVSQIGRDGAAAIPSSMAMDFESAGGTQGPDVFERLCRYMDEQLSKLVLGQTATTDSQGGGLGGSGKEHNDVRGDIERADAKMLAATINRDLARPIIDLNFPSVAGALYPRVKIGRPEAEDIDAWMTSVERYVKLGGRVAVSVVGDKLQLPDPAAGEAILGKPAADLNAAAPGLPPAATTALPAPPQAPAAPFPARAAAAGLLGPLKSSYGAVPLATAAATSAAAPEGPDTGDEIDAAAQALLDDGWEPVLAPIVGPLLAALDTAASFDEAIAALAPTLAAMRPEELARRLLAGAFAVRAEALTAPAGNEGGDQ